MPRARPGSQLTFAARPLRTLARCLFSSAWVWMSSASRPRASARCVRRFDRWTSPCAARPRRNGYSISPLTQLVRASSAAGASSPSALSHSTLPPWAPSASTARMLLASASFPSAPTVTRDRNRRAVFTKVAAGRACRATPGGRVTLDSELAGTAGVLGGLHHVLERLARRRHDRCRHRALDERSVDQANMAVHLAFEQVANGEDRAAEVGEHHHALATVSPCDRLSHRVPAGAERPARAPAGRLDLHAVAGDLGCQVRQAAGEFMAVGDQYNPDQIRHSPQCPEGHRNRVPDDGRSLHYRQEFSNAE